MHQPTRVARDPALDALERDGVGRHERVGSVLHHEAQAGLDWNEVYFELGQRMAHGAVLLTARRHRRRYFSLHDV
jgi:hypothetical protein